jgi:RNA polymerase sigma-70 factor (family 1)
MSSFPAKFILSVFLYRFVAAMSEVTASMTDSELVSLIREGDQNAFAEIFRRYNKLLYAHAYKRLKNKEEARDLVQDVFASLWTKKAVLQINTSLAGYLYSFVRNRFYDIISHKQIASDYLVSLQTFLDQEHIASDYLVREHEFAAIIENEILSLPPRMRLVFEMSRKQHMSHKQIALELGISEQTVTDQIKKALKFLRPRLLTIAWCMLLSSMK